MAGFSGKSLIIFSSTGPCSLGSCMVSSRDQKEIKRYQTKSEKKVKRDQKETIEQPTRDNNPNRN